MFRAADSDNDGVLSVSDIASSDAIRGDLADALADQSDVTLQQFIAECRD